MRDSFFGNGEPLAEVHDQNDLSIDYVGLHFSDPSRNSHQYKLEPNDDDWVTVGKQQTVRFANLNPGEYVFRVRASSVYGIWSDEASLHITVRPPWWQTSWAYVFFLFAFGLAIFTGFEMRVRNLRAKAHELETDGW